MSRDDETINTKTSTMSMLTRPQQGVGPCVPFVSVWQHTHGVHSERNRVKLFFFFGGGGPYLKLLARLNKGLAHDLSS